MGFQQYLIGTILIGLFAFAMISYVYQTSMDNNANAVLSDSVLNRTFSKMNETLNALPDSAQKQQNATADEPATIGYGSIILFSIKSFGTLFTKTIVGIFDTIGVMMGYFAIPPIVIGTISAMVILVAILLAWRIYRSGY